MSPPVDTESDPGSYADALSFPPWVSARQPDGSFVRGGREANPASLRPDDVLSHGDENA